MTSVHRLGAASPTRRPAAALRFITEIAAWVAVPWALWETSILLAVAAVVVLIALPTVFGTPGDKPRVSVAVPGWVTIAILALTLVAGVVAAWIAWAPWVAAVTTVLVVVTVGSEIPRWRWLLSRSDH